MFFLLRTKQLERGGKNSSVRKVALVKEIPSEEGIGLLSSVCPTVLVCFASRCFLSFCSFPQKNFAPCCEMGGVKTLHYLVKTVPS